MCRSLFLAASIIAVSTVPSAGQENCVIPAPENAAVSVGGRTGTLFENACGQRYETGYRLLGNTLLFPGGGSHELLEASISEAETVLRETYGLTGERNHLIRTKW